MAAAAEAAECTAQYDPIMELRRTGQLEWDEYEPYLAKVRKSPGVQVWEERRGGESTDDYWINEGTGEQSTIRPDLHPDLRLERLFMFDVIVCGSCKAHCSSFASFQFHYNTSTCGCGSRPACEIIRRLYCQGHQSSGHAAQTTAPEMPADIKEIFDLILESNMRAQRAEDLAVIVQKERDAALKERASAWEDRQSAIDASRVREANLAYERDYLNAVLSSMRMTTHCPMPAQSGSKRKLETSADSAVLASSSSAASSSGVNQNRSQNAKAIVDSFTPLLLTQIATLPRDECRAYLSAMGPGLQGGSTAELRASLAGVFRANGLSPWKKGDPVNLSHRCQR